MTILVALLSITAGGLIALGPFIKFCLLDVVCRLYIVGHDGEIIVNGITYNTPLLEFIKKVNVFWCY